ncbi:MAG TPA: hypothetical protein VFR85_21420 [Anaeromyxobacteraceae bacterium]|nr:hypothetical protein [Anaeromyxobacteraceae bacterium]
MMLGDHVRALVNGEYRHGIDCGDRTVLFLTRQASGQPEVRRALVEDFAAGAGRLESVVHREPVFEPEAVVARAFSRLRDPAAATSFASSEAFAAWCLTGRPPEPPFAPRPARAAPARRASTKKAAARPRPARKAAPRRRVRRAAPRRKAAPSRKPRRAAPRPAGRKKRPARRAAKPKRR